MYAERKPLVHIKDMGARNGQAIKRQSHYTSKAQVICVFPERCQLPFIMLKLYDHIALTSFRRGLALS
jgi:hypothetical protein